METLERVTRLETQMEAIQSSLADIKTDQKSQLRMLGELVAKDNQRKGALLVIGKVAAWSSGGGIVGAVLTKLLGHV